MTTPDPEHVTRLSRLSSSGDARAAEELFSLLYGELRRMAERQMGDAGGRHTLQPTALVHEAWMRLAGHDPDSIPSRAHFFALASKAMRSVLVDHARRRGTAKRGGGLERLPLDEGAELGQEDMQAVLDVDAAVQRLAEVDPELARIVELRFFGGLSNAEAGEALGVSSRTVERGWRTARAWLKSTLGEGDAG